MRAERRMLSKMCTEKAMLMSFRWKLAFHWGLDQRILFSKPQEGISPCPHEGARAELKGKESLNWQESFREPWNADTSKVAAGYMGSGAKQSRARILENCSVPSSGKRIYLKTKAVNNINKDKANYVQQYNRKDAKGSSRESARLYLMIHQIQKGKLFQRLYLRIKACCKLFICHYLSRKAQRNYRYRLCQWST